MDTAFNDPNEYPDESVLGRVLGPTYSAYARFLDTVTQPPYCMTAEWRYYNDEKSWLCKIRYRKKTVVWMSAGQGFFRTSVYIPCGHFADVDGLAISPGIKEAFLRTRKGKFSPVTLTLRSADDIPDLLTIIGLKKSLV